MMLVVGKNRITQDLVVDGKYLSKKKKMLYKCFNLRYMLTERLVDLLIPKDEGIEECEKYIKENQGEMSAETQLFFESPYLETMLFVSETSRLTYEKADNTGIIRVKERGTETKDRYTSVGYGCYFAMQLARDLLSDSANDDLETAVSCVSSFSF